MKAILISIKPKWCELIAKGQKTVEVRKTRPKIDTPFKCYIYCTQGYGDNTFNIPISKQRILDDYIQTGSMNSLNCPVGNCKVIGEFVCDNISVFEYKRGGYLVNGDVSTTISVQAKSCMDDYQFRKYAEEKNCYAWHISNLVIYDEPKELSGFTGIRYLKDGYELRELDRPPQSWCYVK